MHLISQFLIVFLVIGNVAWLCESNNSSYACIEAERNALVKFKQSFFEDPFGMQTSWKGVRCCRWKGIGCDSNTGNVIKISLPGPGGIYDYNYRLQANKLDSSLLQLRYLTHLDLSFNNFNATPIPEFLGALKGMKYLDLSRANFKPGTFPQQLENFTNLQVLNLTGVDLSGVRNLLPILNKLPSLKVLSLSWCRIDPVQLPPAYSNVTFFPSLRELFLSSNNLISSPFPIFLKNMKSLEMLDLSFNSFSNEIPTWLTDLKKLRHLDLSSNDFSNEVPTWLTDLKELEYLDLSYNNFNKVEGGLLRILSGLCHLKTFHFSSNDNRQWSFESNKSMSGGCITYDLKGLDLRSSGLTGSIPDELWQFKKLKSLVLSGNALHGPVPQSIGNLSALKYLDLSNNQLHGAIPTTIGNLSALTYLVLSYNQLHGAIPTTIGNLSALTYLVLSNNQLHGAIPTTIGNLSALTRLDLSYNQLDNVVPDSIGQLVNLVSIDLSHNNLKGNITETHFESVSNLKYLYLSSNQLTINVAPDWIPPFQLRDMDMSSCKIGGTVIPRWLRSQNKMEGLALSNASIRGPWPKWFRSSSLIVLNLKHNEINGHIPHNIAALFPALAHLEIHNNSMSGTMPISFCEMYRLVELDVSRNMLSGEIPKCLGQMQSLTIMKLSFNHLTGVIPSNIGNLSGLLWLSLNSNLLTGEIPSSLRNCIFLKFLNLGDNGFSGSIPSWIGAMTELRVLVLRNNSLGGYIPMELCQMLSIQILDLAGNNLTGSIPSCIGNLTGMTIEHSIDELYNGDNVLVVFWINGVDQWVKEDLAVTIKGNALKYRNTLQAVTNIDMSHNNFVGIIPQELTLLSHLLGLNLSHNHLTGSIPENIGNLTSLESLDLSNNLMFGNIPAGMSIPSLEYLNLSHNNFSGQIPTGTQLQTFTDLSVYDGNTNLCGTPLPRKCPRPEHEEKNHDDHDNEDKFDKVWLYLAITSGFGVGIWAFFGLLMFKKQWRYAYFRYMDYAIDWVYVFTVVNTRRLKRKMGMTPKAKSTAISDNGNVFYFLPV